MSVVLIRDIDLPIVGRWILVQFVGGGVQNETHHNPRRPGRGSKPLY